MKLITISKIGYNAPSGANWAYGIWKIDLIDTTQKYNASYTVKENFDGNSRLYSQVKEQLGYELIETKGVFTTIGTPKITGVTRMYNMESKEIIEIIKEFLKK